MYAFQPLGDPRPRGLRASTPKTPEPREEVEPQLPSPPRQRLRLRRRNAPRLSAPTQQFLASVEAADVPIQSIEEPCVLDEDMVDISRLDGFNHSTHLDDELASERLFSPPKTPAPSALPLLSRNRFPEWAFDSAASSPESSPESSRPSTARSAHTSISLFSQASLTSDLLSQCDSTHVEYPGKASHASRAEHDILPLPSSTTDTARRRRAPWTQDMSEHLWSTYQLYIQDPKVTPVRVGKSGIPPNGACIRVAREAKRSWKGARRQPRLEAASRSATPTGDVVVFKQWPHTRASTITRLKELCKADAGPTSRALWGNRRHISRSCTPTPLMTETRHISNRCFTPTPSISTFCSSDMAMSLAVSTSDSMQPQGPLARLTQTQTQPMMAEAQQLGRYIAVDANVEARQADLPRARLGSPFVAKSYGPSSSNTLVESLGLGAQESRQSHTVGPRRRLGSLPLSTRRRKTRHMMIESRRSRRPSLAPDFWTDPAHEETSTSATSQAEYCSIAAGRDNLAVPRKNLQELFTLSQSCTGRDKMPEIALDGPRGAPARLRSPFSVTKSSWSFPNRLTRTTDKELEAVRRPFATVQQPSEGSGPDTRSSLASRLAYIDEKLKDIRRRSQSQRRSQSPR